MARAEWRDNPRVGMVIQERDHRGASWRHIVEVSEAFVYVERPLARIRRENLRRYDLIRDLGGFRYP